jgi:high-affinity Fe2+/Pb2+ permease
MLEDFQEDQRKRTARVRSIMDFTMGILIIAIGLYFLLYNKLHINIFNRQPSVIDYFIGAMFILYGIWRMYRGYKKDYFR